MAMPLNGLTAATHGGMQTSSFAWQPGYSAVRSGLVDQWQQIFEDQTVKDVEIRLKDDEIVWADSLILKVTSPVFKTMLAPENQEEKGELKLCISDFTLTEVRFFLRLLYTGRMDPSDWPADDPPYEHEQLPTLPGSLVCQPPATTEPVLPLDGRQSLAGSVLHASPGMMVSMLAKGKGKGIAGKGKEKGRLMRSPPISLLMTAVALAKQFQVDWLTYVLVDVIKRRISEVSFESILAAAVAHDIAPIRLAALDFARKSVEVWRRYDNGEYAPEVLFELRSAFRAPASSTGETITI